MWGFIYNNGLIINGGQKDIRTVKFYIFHLRSKWYRKYSDKWIEQGNKFGANTGSWADVTFNLLKSFTNNNYIIHLQGNWSSPECSSCLVLSKSSTAIKVRHANNYYSTMPSTYVAQGY